MRELSESIDFKNLISYYKCLTASVDFNHFTLYGELKSHRMKLDDTEKKSNRI